MNLKVKVKLIIVFQKEKRNLRAKLLLIIAKIKLATAMVLQRIKKWNFPGIQKMNKIELKVKLEVLGQIWRKRILSLMKKIIKF